MRLNKVILNNFRNYTNASIDINADIVCIVGENGAGKTNIIDAIYYLLLTKSALNNIDTQNIRHEEDYFYLKAELKKQDKTHQILLAVGKGKKKTLKVNDAEIEKFSDHIGNFPVVLIAPDDITILLGGSEERRKFFDGTLSQTNKNYLSDLIKYQHYLKQRNSALKKFADTNRVDHTLLDQYDEQLINYGKKIFSERKSQLLDYQPDFENNYALISDEKELVEIIYRSDFEDIEKLNLKNIRQKDLILQRTTWGIHKDDYEFLINQLPVKKYASQGQRKSFLISLKLAQFDFINRNKQFKPLLLLDDIFDKLDDKRIIQLLNMIQQNRFGQTFFTDARADYTQNLFKEREIDFQLIKVDNGKIL